MGENMKNRFVERTPTPTQEGEQPDARGFRSTGMLRYSQVMPLVGALQSLERDGDTPEIRAQAAALAAARVLMPSPRASQQDAHDACVDTLRALVDVPAQHWPVVARAVRTAALTLLDEVGALSEDEADRLFNE